MSFGGSSSKAGGDKQSKRTRLHERHYGKTETVRQIERGNKQGKEQIITAEYKFCLTDQIATESKALHGELGTTRRTQHRHEERERGSIQTKDFQSQKSLTVKSTKCKLLFTLEM